MLILDVNPAEASCSQRLFACGRPGGGRYRAISWATICWTLLNGASAVYAQQTQTAGAVAKTRSLHCQHPADPRRRHSGCIDEDFDLDDTLAGEWNGLRTEMMKIGVTPTLSYAGVLQTNVAGGAHGADFILQEGNKGALVIGEIDYLLNQRASSRGRQLMPTAYTRQSGAEPQSRMALSQVYNQP
jgi:hypothetical protein